MIRGVLVDTGPLVALLNGRDRHHKWAIAQAGQVEWPMLTCEPVLAETFYLLRGAPAGRLAVLGMLERGALQIPFRLEEQVRAVAGLLDRYADVPMSLADACLVRMSELADGEGGTVFTLDSDFRVYRRGRRRKIPVLMPPKQ